MEVKGWGGWRRERQMTQKKRWHTWRKKGRAREKEEGSGSHGMVWNKREAEMGNKTGKAKREDLLWSRMSKWYPQMLRAG